ncbi:MAG: FHA domain-containing protein [Acidobacteriia bacterium]|nr:FHA domain-containing protein [Terriglobia bacterium]
MSPNDGVTRILNLDAQQLDRAAELEKLRRNITVLFTDIKGSTAYFEKFGDSAGLLMVFQCNNLLSKCVERHGGRVIKTIGDAVMASFEDHCEAVAASIEMQEAITADNSPRPETHRVTVRIGINYGLGFVKSNDVFGDVVNVASRVEGAASPEQILISDTLHQAVAPSGRFRFRHAGKFSLKGKAEVSDLFEVVWREQADAGVVSSHSMVVAAVVAPQIKYKLVQLRSDGRAGREFDISQRAVIGRTLGEITFPNDEYMQPVHARLLVESGQLFLEPVADADSFFSLVGTYRLQHGDVVSFGAQVLEFHVDEAALAEASRTGTGLGELTAMLHGAVAEFVSLNPDGKRYPIREQQTTWGRTKATYTFPTDTAMSRSHAKVYHRGEDFFIEDVGSTNGTFVMARGKTPIPAGAVLSIGGQRLRVSREEGAAKSVRVG